MINREIESIRDKFSDLKLKLFKCQLALQLGRDAYLAKQVHTVCGDKDITSGYIFNRQSEYYQEVFGEEEKSGVIETDFQNALRLVSSEIKNDSNLYYAYQANIAVQFQDEMARIISEGKDIDRTLIHQASNNAAKNFLNLWLKDGKETEDEKKRHDRPVGEDI